MAFWRSYKADLLRNWSLVAKYIWNQFTRAAAIGTLAPGLTGRNSCGTVTVLDTGQIITGECLLRSCTSGLGQTCSRLTCQRLQFRGTKCGTLGSGQNWSYTYCDGRNGSEVRHQRVWRDHVGSGAEGGKSWILSFLARQHARFRPGQHPFVSCTR